MNFLAFFSRKSLLIWIGVCTCLFCIISCSSENEEELFPAPMVLEDISYLTNIEPILQNNCYGCHSMANSVNGGEHVLEGYTELKKFVDQEKLLGVIRYEDGFSQMPPFGMLSATQIETIEVWIEEGALDN